MQRYTISHASKENPRKKVTVPGDTWPAVASEVNTLLEQGFSAEVHDNETRTTTKYHPGDNVR